MLDYDELREPTEGRVLLRNPDDIVLAGLPIGWSNEHARSIFGGILLISVIWLISLRRRVIKQTKLLHEQLQKEAHSQMRYRQIIDSTSDFIYTLNLEGAFTSFNKAGEHLTGYSSDEAQSLSVFDLLEDTVAKRITAALTQHSNEKFTPIETELARKDETRLWVEATVDFVRQDGQTVSAFGIMRDISSRKQVEALRNARDAAEINAQAKSAFLANMSQELRIQTNSVIGMTNILLESQLNDEQQNIATTIQDSAESLLVLLNDILDLSKAEAGKLSIELRDFDLNETLRQSVAMLSTVAASKGLELRTEIDEGVADMLRGDADRLRQILINLVGNAIAFTEKGNVIVRISQINDSEKETTLRFEVTDSGIGIPKGALEGLFRPFEQADDSHSRRLGGTGLGLPISRQLVELMNGEMGVDSTVDEGSTFWFHVTLGKVQGTVVTQLPSAPASEALNPSSQIDWDAGDIEILMADDHPVNQRVTSLQLKKLGLSSDIVDNGVEVLEAVEKKRYDIILMDCQMPKMDGYKASEELRKHPHNAGLYIIALTANAMEGDRQRCLDAGMNDLIRKPIRADKLLAALQCFADSRERSA